MGKKQDPAGVTSVAKGIVWHRSNEQPKKFLIISCPKHTESVRKAIKLYWTEKKIW